MKSDALLLHQLPDVIECDHVSPSGKNWHSIPCSFRCARGCESAPGKLGNNSTRGGLFLGRELLGRLEDIIIDINCSAHASDAIASTGNVKPSTPLPFYFVSSSVIELRCYWRPKTHPAPTQYRSKKYGGIFPRSRALITVTRLPISTVPAALRCRAPWWRR